MQVTLTCYNLYLLDSIKTSFEPTYLHKLGSFLLALKISRNPLVHLCPSVKSLSVHGMSALTVGSKDEMFMGLFEQYH